MKLMLRVLVVAIAIVPMGAFAHPGPVDQYGGHSCFSECVDPTPFADDYHFHSIPLTPHYYVGINDTVLTNQSYYIPFSAMVETDEPETMDLEEMNFSVNEEYDQLLCGTATVFAPGVYDLDGSLRVSPVCHEPSEATAARSEIARLEIYQEVTQDEAVVNRVYHTAVNALGNAVYTDMAPISELAGSYVQGETDSQIYFVEPSPLLLRPVMGVPIGYTLYTFSDSIIYSYPRM